MKPTETQLARARYIRTVLAWHNVTQAELGQLIGCTQVAAGRKLRGLRRFNDDELLIIADTFGLDPGLMLRPPPLDDLLGAVPATATGLLPCTFRQAPQVTALRTPPRPREPRFTPCLPVRAA